MQNYYLSSRDESPSQDTNDPIAMETNNKYVYVKQNFVPTVQGHIGSKVLVNPLFNKKVFVNPNYHVLPPPMSTTIHINPRMKPDLPENLIKSNIHINPKVLRTIPITESNYSTNCLPTDKTIEQPPLKPAVVTLQKTIRRKSICSQFKIVRSTYSQLNTNTSIEQPPKTAAIVPSPKRMRRSVYSKFKIVRSINPNSRTEGCNRKQHNTGYKFSRKVELSHTQKSPPKSKVANMYKLDNRINMNISLAPSKNKFVFINRFLCVSDIAKMMPLKTNRTSKYNVGIRASMSKKTSPQKILRVQNTTTSKSKYKFVRRTPLPAIESKGISIGSPGRMKKCNIPCSFYRKFGRCKGKDNGKCNRKHDPDQIALCTKFLQGACIDEKCLLSHNLSPEKMPTCRFYLEGNCTRDECPYLHVRISPTADICRDFLEGYCKQASKCDKRHQFLCPDYEKRGCAKVRCPYPHGKMVRKYSLLNRNKFAKKSSDNVDTKPSEKCINIMEVNQILSTEELAINPASSNQRYYAEGKVIKQQNIDELENHVHIENYQCDHNVGFRSRPKLGELPSYIAFEEL